MISDTLQKVLNIGIDFSREKDREKLLDRILTSAMDITHCDGGTLYIHVEDTLEFRIMITRSMGIHQGAGAGETTLPPVPLSEKNVCACGVLFRRLINIPDVYESEHYDFSGPKKYDAITGYHTKSMLVVPLEDDKEHVIGVLQLINALDEAGQIVPFSEEHEQILLSLGSQAAICLTNMNYAGQIRAMLNSYVKVMSTAIDARTPYNANHTKNMVIYAMRFIAWLKKNFPEACLDEKKQREFIMSVWLHDIGKLITPIEIMDKQSRLAANYQRIIDRLERIRMITRIAWLEGRLEETKAAALIEETRDAAALIKEINEAGFLSEEQLEAARTLATRTYIEEDGSTCGWITEEEAEQLQIRKGTLTDKERSIMQDHVQKTRMMLEQMTLGEDFQDVLTWASEHHELLNGTGYPQGLSGTQICPEVRMLTILDIFEAMTAVDRPYKQPMPAEHALEIMHDMADHGQLDTNILSLFEQSRAWEK